MQLNSKPFILVLKLIPSSKQMPGIRREGSGQSVLKQNAENAGDEKLITRHEGNHQRYLEDFSPSIKISFT